MLALLKREIFKYASEMASDGIIYLSSNMTIG